MNDPKVYIILLNYKNWQDTLECLLSINKQSYTHFEVVVVDNNSENDSLSHIQLGLANQILVYKLSFIPLSENGGFAKGNNVGLEYALGRMDGEYFWVLNNDTTLDADALQYLVNEALEDCRRGHRIGLYGSKLRYYAKPELLQAMGGGYNKWLGTLKEIGNLEYDNGQYDALVRPNVLIGAALFATQHFLEEVGLLGEGYFIYFEEIDWAERARQKGWGIKVVPQSIVFHKQGMATEANGLDNANKSVLSDFYYFRNRLRITDAYFSHCLPTVYLSYLFTALNRIRRGQWGRLAMLVKVLFRFRTIRFSDI